MRQACWCNTMRTKWTIFFVLIGVLALTEDGFGDKSCHCRSGCSENICHGGCYTGWAQSNCTKKTFHHKSCSYNETTNDLDCKDVCFGKKKKWDGPYCTRENVAFRSRKTKLQNDIVEEQCENITEVDIHLKKNATAAFPVIEIFADHGTHLHVDNCTVSVKGKDDQQFSCTSSPNGTPVYNHSHLFTCGKTGKTKSITIDCRSNSKSIQLCLSEVKVYTCKKFWWGPETRCASPCNCKDGKWCSPQNGKCKTECADGFYGRNCSSRCPELCGDNVCDKQTGICPTIDNESTLASASALTSGSAASLITPTSAVSVASTSLVDAPSSSPVDTPTSSPVDIPTSSPVDITTSIPVDIPLSSPDDTLSTGLIDNLSTPSNQTTVASTDFTTIMNSAPSAPDTSVYGTVTTPIPEDGSQSTPVSALPPSSASHTTSKLSFTNTTEVPTQETDSAIPSTVTIDDVPFSSESPGATKVSVSTTPVASSPTTASSVFTMESSTSPASSEIPTTAGMTRPTSVSVTTQQEISTFTSKQVTSSVDTTSKAVGGVDRAAGSAHSGDGNGDGGDSDDVVSGVLFGLAGLVLVGVVVGVLVYRRYRLQGGGMSYSSDEPFVDEEHGEDTIENSSRSVFRLRVRAAKGQNKPRLASYSQIVQNDSNGAAAPIEDGTLYANTGQMLPAVTPIPVESLRNHINNMHSTRAFDKEFHALPKGLLGTVVAATESLSSDLAKNRFKDIFPYDDTRVVLTKEKASDSDYINASYIDGFAEVMAYIAAQGPLPDTVGDFWHMIWTEGCGKIVMLTNLWETAKVKCEQYWPSEENSSKTFGKYTVTLLKVTTRAYFVQRTLGVTSSSQGGDDEACRQIHHFHFTAWPDHGVPSAPAVVEFWELIQHTPCQLDGPLLVHCSAGVGRTGTYIALDILVHQAEAKGTVSIFPAVRRLRQQRLKMVQTATQYVFVHEVLAEVLSSRDTYISQHDLQHGSDWMPNPQGGRLPDAVRDKFVAQFQLLDRLRPVPSLEDTSTALLPENTSKNRVSHILPVEQSRVCLWSPDENTSDYINAVFLPSMTQQLGFIVTQLPLANTAADFWSMVADWRVKVVVRFLSSPQQQTEPLLCPTKGNEAKFGSLTVRNIGTTPWKQGIHKLALELCSEGTGDQKASVCVYCVDLEETSALNSTSAFLAMAYTLLPIVDTLPQPPIVVQCLDGASLSCTLCAVVTALQMLQADGRVSPYTIARSIHKARPQAFSVLDQYEFVVRCLLDHTRRVQISEEAVSADTPDVDQETDPSANIYANV